MGIHFHNLYGVSRNQPTNDRSAAPINNHRISINGDYLEPINDEYAEPVQGKYIDVMQDYLDASIDNHREEISRSSAKLTSAAAVDRCKAKIEFRYKKM